MKTTKIDDTTFMVISQENKVLPDGSVTQVDAVITITLQEVISRKATFQVEIDRLSEIEASINALSTPVPELAETQGSDVL